MVYLIKNYRYVLISLFIVLCLFGKGFPEEYYPVPEWAKNIVWYQIFPERFCNGDTLNDPTLNDIQGAWPHGDTSEWHLSPWTSDWYKLQPWENDHDFYYHAQRRRYGGDLIGVVEKLDYLKELGINGIYLNPIFQSPSLHKYDGASYHHIDGNFGPDPNQDKSLISQENPEDPKTWVWTTADTYFVYLIRECHKRDIKIIIDGVFNHVGLKFWAFVDIRENGEKSKYRNWFNIKSYDNPDTEKDEFDYEGWFGVRELPAIREDDHGFYPPAWEYMKHAIQKWMDPNGDGDPSDGIDGWRLDVAEHVGFPAWRKFRHLVRSINSEAYLVGEVWWKNWPNEMFNARPWLEGDVFDAVMNYRWANEVQHFFIDHKNKITVSEFNENLNQLLLDYPSDVNYVLQNLMDSHDTDRLASNILNPDMGYDARVNPKETKDYNVQKPSARHFQVQSLITLFQMTYIGAPMLFYGTEAGMWGADDPDERKPMIWPEFNYESEKTHPFNLNRRVDTVQFNKKTFKTYQKLIQIRHEQPALRLGNFSAVYIDDKNDVLGYTREWKKEKILVILNRSELQQSVEIDDMHGDWFDLIDNNEYLAKDNTLNMKILPVSGIILKLKEN